ncbi:hypothetical protein BH11BAC2_BH11BAC2_05210 [soil metagenome]
MQKMIHGLQKLFNKNLLYFGLFFFMMIMNSCKNEVADNPYDDVNYNTGSDQGLVPDSNSITGLHKNIFSKRCANPGCHDGTFEPDFRTVQSTYSTLVFMPVNKTTVDSVSFFTTRVIPGDVNKSFLHERLVTTTSDYMPSNGVRLTDNEIGHINTWIANGAKDVNGNPAVKPNIPPTVVGYIAVDLNYMRLDTIRYNGISTNPFVAPANSNMIMALVATDTADGTSATDPSQFTVFKLKLSTLKDDFSAATTINCAWMSPIPFGAWQAQINTSAWSFGTTVYMRVYVNDGFQPFDVEFPNTLTYDYFKTYFAFIIQ